jgi:SAM-dependent methyltransferase
MGRLSWALRLVDDQPTDRAAPAAETDWPRQSDSPCPACGTAAQRPHLYEKNGCHIYRCSVCGLGRSDTQGFDPAAFYTADYFSGQHPDGYGDYLATEPILRREFGRVVDFVRRFRPGGKLLELGCAYGFFLQEAKRYFNVAGVELAEDAAAHARRAGLDVVSGVADEVTLRRFGAMDVIVLLDVIEHLPDPRGTLGFCTRTLRPGGVVVLTTGDFGSLFAKLAGRHWRLMTPPQHLWFFTPKSMAYLAKALGLELVSLDHPWKVVPLSLVAFQLRRMLGLGGGRVSSTLGLPINLFDAMRIVLRKPVHT